MSAQQSHVELDHNEKLGLSIKDCPPNQECSWYEIFVVGSKIPRRRAYHVSFVWNNEFYIHGGQDLKDGSFGDMWKIDMSFLNADNQEQMFEGNEIENIEWHEVVLQGQYPRKIAHHQGVLQEGLNMLIIYGGMVGIDSSDVIYAVNLSTFNFQAISAKDQREKNNKPLPGPRDDFCLVTINQESQQIKPMYLIGGFKNGMKMNDLYKLHYIDRQFIWELIELQSPKSPIFEPRSSFAAACIKDDHGHEHLYVFGGSGENNEKFNDLWEFDGTKWTERIIQKENEELKPLQKSGHQMAIYKDRFIFIFGGIHEITYEMNDLRYYDIKTQQWQIIEEENKNASESGSPKHKMINQQAESFKKNSFKNSPKHNKISNLHGVDSPLNHSAIYAKKNLDDTFTKSGQQSKMNSTFNGNPFLNIKVRSLSRRKKNRSPRFKSPQGATTTGEGQQSQIVQNGGKDQAQHHGKGSKDARAGAELLTPTSISMKNAFIIKNADVSFDHYFHLMKRRRSPNPGSPSKAGHHGTGQNFFSPHTTGAHHHHGHGGHIHQQDQTHRIKIIPEKQPPGRDGHSAYLYGDKWIIFGGDRHHMPFNDTYVLDIGQLQLNIQ